MARTAIGELFHEARVAEQIKLAPRAGILFRREHRRVKLMLVLIGQPIRVPLLALIFLLEASQAFALEKFRQLLRRRLAQIRLDAQPFTGGGGPFPFPATPRTIPPTGRPT